MALKDVYNFEYLKNEAERLVLEELEKQLDSEKYKDICKCEDCVLDMAAYALNSVKPLYRVSLIGTLYAHATEGTDYEKDIIDAVKVSIDKISKNPSHS